MDSVNSFVTDCYNKITGAQPDSQTTVRNKLIKYDTTIVTPTLASETPTNKKHDYEVMLDSGASKDFISRSVVDHLQLPVRRARDAFPVALADGTIKQVAEVAKDVPLLIGDFFCTRDLYILDMAGLDIVLGKPFLYDHNCSVDFTTNVTNIRKGDTVHVLHPSGIHNSCTLHHCDLVDHKQMEQAQAQGEKIYAAYFSVPGSGKVR